MTEHHFKEGDRVRIDITDKTDPDYGSLHGKHGEIVAILKDDAGDITGDIRDGVIFRVQMDNGKETDVRWRALRPP